MIRASCDRCGEEIPSEEKAGCRVLIGPREWSFHLCLRHQADLVGMIEEWLEAHDWRRVK
jgi:hypothetical protein